MKQKDVVPELCRTAERRRVGLPKNGVSSNSYKGGFDTGYDLGFIHGIEEALRVIDEANQ